MDIKHIKALADLMSEKNLTGLEIWEGDSKIILSKPTSQSSVAVAPVAPAQPVASTSAESAPPPADTNKNILASPLVGCVYLKPSPDADCFVSVGSSVKKGQTLCIIEAMKVMNEFTAPQDGIIVEIYAENEQLVEYGQSLFRFQ